ncbi:hypothetical protein [Streptomyces sp. YIM S03343]
MITTAFVGTSTGTTTGIGTGTATDVTALPGVRIWLSRLLTDLNGGRSCLWLLPRTLLEGPNSPAGHLLDELLHELPDFILLPPDDPTAPQPVRSQAIAQLPPPERWSGLAPVLDYDDGLPDFASMAVPPPVETAAPSATALPTPAEALAGLLERLSKELESAFHDRMPAARTTGTTGDDDTAGDVLTRLTGSRSDHQGGHPSGYRAETRPVIVRAWREPVPSAAADLLRRLVATGKEAGLPPKRGPRALVVASTEDVPPGLPEQLAREDIAVHWWWGVIGRLDTATVVALSRPPLHSTADRHHLHEAVTQATITEICGPFLDAAAALAAHWKDGRLETLPDALRDVLAVLPAPDAADTAVPAHRPEATRNPGRRPEESLLAAWNTGAVESWDGRLRIHPHQDLGHEHVVAARVWLAQNHVLLPLLDDARERFAATMRRRTRIPLPRLAEEYGPPDTTSEPLPPAKVIDTLELGAMWAAHCDGAITLTPAERHHLRTLRDTRNLLAHRKPLDGDHLHRLIKELCR